jgi:hypothetical protein
MGILPMLFGIPTGGTPVRLMGKMPMLRFVRVLKEIIPSQCEGLKERWI